MTGDVSVDLFGDWFNEGERTMLGDRVDQRVSYADMLIRKAGATPTVNVDLLDRIERVLQVLDSAAASPAPPIDDVVKSQFALHYDIARRQHSPVVALWIAMWKTWGRKRNGASK